MELSDPEKELIKLLVRQIIREQYAEHGPEGIAGWKEIGKQRAKRNQHIPPNAPPTATVPEPEPVKPGRVRWRPDS